MFADIAHDSEDPQQPTVLNMGADVVLGVDPAAVIAGIQSRGGIDLEAVGDQVVNEGFVLGIAWEDFRCRTGIEVEIRRQQVEPRHGEVLVKCQKGSFSKTWRTIS